jgi:16S rRNA (cytosine967-C5)-methyltransferase
MGTQLMTTSFKEILQTLQPDVLQTLRAVFWGDTFATKAIHHTLDNHKDWDDAKKAMFSDIVYEIVRWWKALWFILNTEPTPEEPQLQRLITIYLFTKKGDLTALQKKRGLEVTTIMQRITTAKNTRVLRESIPDWLDKQGATELGARWDAVLSALNRPPDQIIRVNTLKTTPKELVTTLRKQGLTVETLEGNPDALRLGEKTNLFSLPSFQKGLFEVQDAASQMVSRLLDPHPGMRIVDACAGEGSKTLHCAALMKNKGKIIALDTQEWRLKQLRKRAARAGADIIETRVITSSKTYKRMRETADRLLLDVPCSGLGTLRRNPDIKWKLTPEDFQRLKTLQQDLLETYCALTKPGGRLVYSVCSIFPSEGEEPIKRFCADHQEFSLDKEQRYWPDTEGTDGFYTASLQKSSTHK